MLLSRQCSLFLSPAFIRGSAVMSMPCLPLLLAFVFAGRVWNADFIVIRFLAYGSSAPGAGDDFIRMLLSASKPGASGVCHTSSCCCFLCTVDLPLLVSPTVLPHASFGTSLRRPKRAAHCGVCFEACISSTATLIQLRLRSFSILHRIAPRAPKTGTVILDVLLGGFFLSELAYLRVTWVVVALDLSSLQFSPPFQRPSASLHRTPVTPSATSLFYRFFCSRGVPMKHSALLFLKPSQMTSLYLVFFF